MIEFSQEFPFWSRFAFWYALANGVATAGFLVLVIVGGIFDLRYLFRALKEEQVDERDDGRVTHDEAREAGGSYD